MGKMAKEIHAGKHNENKNIVNFLKKYMKNF